MSREEAAEEAGLFSFKASVGMRLLSSHGADIPIYRRRISRLFVRGDRRHAEAQEFRRAFWRRPVGRARPRWALTIVADGKAYAALEARSMIVGSLCLFRLRLLLHAPHGEAHGTRDAGNDCRSRRLARLCARRVVRFSEVASDENQSSIFRP